MNRLIILTGAPETTKLDWSEGSLIPHDPASATTAAALSHDLTDSSLSSTTHAQWRQLPPIGEHSKDTERAAGADADHIQEIDSAGTQFLTPGDLVSPTSPSSGRSTSQESGSVDSGSAASDALSEFYNHSFSVHRDIPASLVSEAELDSALAGRSSFDSDGGTPASPSSAIRTSWYWPTLPAPQTQHLSDLEDIPNAAYLRSIEPQTMTVNLIVGILSIAPPRSVTTGTRWGRQRQTELVELLVGDETKTGFSITMWLPPEMRVSWRDASGPGPDGSRSTLRRNLRLLRPRDIILLRNVALSSFQGKVHGQSLRNDVTKVDLLFRKKHDREDLGGSYSVQAVNAATKDDPQLMKVKKVKDWLVNFVAEPEEESRSRWGRRRKRAFPPDTQ